MLRDKAHNLALSEGDLVLRGQCFSFVSQCAFLSLAVCFKKQKPCLFLPRFFDERMLWIFGFRDPP